MQLIFMGDLHITLIFIGEKSEHGAVLGTFVRSAGSVIMPLDI
jgi:hypothetical protein